MGQTAGAAAKLGIELVLNSPGKTQVCAQQPIILRKDGFYLGRSSTSLISWRRAWNAEAAAKLGIELVLNSPRKTRAGAQQPMTLRKDGAYLGRSSTSLISGVHLKTLFWHVQRGAVGVAQHLGESQRLGQLVAQEVFAGIELTLIKRLRTLAALLQPP